MSGDPGDDEEDSSAETFVRELARAPPASPPIPERDRNGEVLGHFELRRILGRGGMGVVYEARDLALRRPVAVKLLRGSSVDDAERRQRFLREARAAAAVSHPNLAAVYEVGEIGGEIFIAMELVEGRSLRAVLEHAGARLPEAEALRIAREIARGLAAAHQAGVVHRDLKPENVMVEAGGGVKVLDFGLAKVTRAGGGAGGGEAIASDLATSEGRILGSPGYMSPEQARGLPVDARSDVFACGVVLYELLAGERPFQGKTLMDVVAAIVRDPEPPLVSKNPAVSSGLAGIVSCCLDKDPGRRFADAGRLLAALEAVTASQARPPIRWPWRRWFAPHTRLSFVYAMPPFLLAIAAAAWVTLRPARPQGPAITDLPLPTSSRAEAIDAYRIAVQSLRDADWRQAESSLRQAVALDPSMATAHLRLAMVLAPPTLRAPPPEAQAAYGEAARLRGALSVRDRRLLVALEPVLHADPIDLQETVRRLRELTEDYPRDAELFFLLAIYRLLDAPELQLQAARRAVELDPEYADGWQVVGRALAETDPRQAVAALEKCAAVTPAGNDCWGERAWLESALGRCTDAEVHYRRLQASAPVLSPVLLSRQRAAMLHALGKSREAVAEALREGRKQLEPGVARQAELEDGALVAVAYGDFEAARAQALEGLRLIDSNPNLQLHAAFTRLLADIELETGRGPAAVAPIQDFLRRRDGWRLGTPTDDPTVYLTRVLARAGALSRDELRARRDAWYRAASPDMAVSKAVVWAAAYVHGIEREDEAAEALAARPRDAAWPTVNNYWLGADLGRALWLGGKRDEALPHLEGAFRRCDRFPHFFHQVRADLLLGRALEERGQRDRACEVYRSVLGWWGQAKPRSVTADEARGRAQALGCRAAP